MEFLTFYVARFDTEKGDYVRWSGSMSLDNCRKVIKQARHVSPTTEFQIIAVLDE